ncbi:MAG: ABC transporter permease [Candidatus Hydrogenedentes bacterium]|nr:ABC transporter permease [Candidatus Hydrogenedentota bacterium]
MTERMGTGFWDRARRFMAEHSALFILAGLCVALGIYSDSFRSVENLQSVAQRTPVVGILALGQLLVILTGGIDLSVGSVAALGGVLGCMAMLRVMAWLAAEPAMASGATVLLASSAGVLSGVLVGLACGLLCGLLVTRGRIPPFVVTLGMMMGARGAALVVSGAKPVSRLPLGFAWLGGTRAWWIPVLLMLGLAAVFSFMLSFTRFGRALYATGGNMEAARLSGIGVDRVRVAAYAICGAMAGLAGMVLASRTSVAAPTGAEMHELYAIAACVIGGASLSGGEGGAFAAIAGALIMMVLYNFCTIQNISVHWQQILIGLLLVVLVFYDTWRKRRAGILRD